MTGPKRAPIYHSDCIEIVLTRGYSTFVDLDCPADILARTWHACKEPRVYAVTNIYEASIKSPRMLHRLLLASAADGLDIDHIDPLNNRLSNLRVCTRRQNLANIGARTGQYRGIYWEKRRRKWVVRLTWTQDGTCCCKAVGRFDDEEEAARAWDAAALSSGLYDPEFLRLNFPTV